MRYALIRFMYFFSFYVLAFQGKRTIFFLKKKIILQFYNDFLKYTSESLYANVLLCLELKFWLNYKKRKEFRFNYLAVDVLWQLVMLNLCRAKTCFFGKSCINKGGCPWCTIESNFRTSCCQNCCSRPGSTCCPCSSA